MTGCCVATEKNSGPDKKCRFPAAPPPSAPSRAKLRRVQFAQSPDSRSSPPAAPTIRLRSEAIPHAHRALRSESHEGKMKRTPPAATPSLRRKRQTPPPLEG